MPRFTPRVFFLLPADPHSSQILSSHLGELGGHVRRVKESNRFGEKKDDPGLETTPGTICVCELCVLICQQQT